MSDGAYTRLRGAAGRLRPGQQARSEAEALQHRVDDLTAHIAHVEKRLHHAEQALARFADAGLAMPKDPARYARWLLWAPPGDRRSPVPDVTELDALAGTIWPNEPPADLPGIALRAAEQLQTFSEIATLARRLPVRDERTDAWRYHAANGDYGAGDALTLHGMLRQLRPRRLVQIGASHSTAMALDTIEHYLAWQTELTLVAPDTNVLGEFLRPGDTDRFTVAERSALPELGPGDVLFIESTHVLKTGSDVAWLFADVLPSLPAGVHVHLHGVYYPFEYPKQLVLEGRAWNEAYVARAFLSFNADFEIVLFNDWLRWAHADRIAAELPAMAADPGSTLWLRRVG